MDMIEQSVIGSMLISPEVTGYVMSGTTADDFTDPDLRDIYCAARALYLSGSEVDPALIAARLDKSKSARIVECMQITPTAANIESYVPALRDRTRLRRMQSIAMQVVDAQTVDDAAKLLASIEAETVDRPGIKPVSFAAGMRDLLDWLKDETPPQYLNWGIEAINKRIAVEAGDFVILGADSSTGKTALALQLAANIAASGKRVGFYSLETNTRKAYQRVAAQMGLVNFQDVKFKRKRSETISAISYLAERTSLPFDIINLPGASADEVRAITVAQHYDVVFIDYVQLMSDSARDRYEKVTNISMALHTMAQRLGVTVVGLSQVTVQNGDKKKTTLATRDDLRDSRQLKQDADVVIMMSLVAPEDTRRWFVISKNKDGALGKICLDFDYEHMSFKVTDAPGDNPYTRAKNACDKARKERRETDRQVTFEDVSNDLPLPF